DLGPGAFELRARGGLLGNDVLRCFRFTLDPVRSQVLLERVSSRKGIALPGAPPFDFEAQGNDIVLRPASVTPPDLGLVSGDRLVGIRGKSIADIDRKEIADMILGEANTTGSVDIERGG